MLFNSHIFLFVFLPTLLLLVFVLSKTVSNRNIFFGAVFLASLLFYAYHKPEYVVLIVLSILINYLFYLAFSKYSKKSILFLAVFLNLLVLSIFKYTKFVVDNLNSAAGVDIAPVDITLPLAISFFTFQQISFLVENFRDRQANVSFIRYALYISFFPQLIAGPIVRFSEFFPQFDNFCKNDRSRANISIGLSIFAIGLFKKVVIADKVGITADSVFAVAGQDGSLTLLPAWLGVVSYSLQIYFDFSGYSDMAVGLARLFGIKLPINFNSPYQATSIIDFWRRWHITLSFFLRDFVYKPLGGSRFGAAAFVRNLFVTMLLAGLWHGAGWTFVFWGGLHGFYLAVNHLARRFLPPLHIGTFAKVVMLNFFVLIAWVPFRAPDFETTVLYWRAMSGMNGIALPTFLKPHLGEMLTHIGLEAIRFESVLFAHVFPVGYSVFGLIPLVVGLLIAFLFPNTSSIFRRYQPVISLHGHTLESGRFGFLAWRPTGLWALFVALVFATSIVLQGKPNEFLYFQF